MAGVSRNPKAAGLFGRSGHRNYLRWRALAEIRKQPGCSDVQGIAINRVLDPHAENNWSLCAFRRRR